MQVLSIDIQLAIQIAILCIAVLTIFSLLGCIIKQYYGWIYAIINWTWYLINRVCVALVFGIIILQSAQLQELSQYYFNIAKQSFLHLFEVYASIHKQISK